MSAIRSAISPETPVSISSNTIVGSLTARKEEQYKQVKQQAEVLTKARTKAAREVEKQLAARLIPLGMPNVRFQIEMGLKKEPGLQGEDTVNFLFSANKNRIEFNGVTL